MYKNCIKRIIDIVLSSIGLIVLAIPMAVIAVIVKLDSKGPVLFWQKRVGIHKTTFMMPKFRTMYTDTPANMPTHMLNDPERWITKSGRWLRKLSLDELPQILCIAAGQMSVIGPRPALWNQYDLIAERDKYGANDVLPGLTGWAQIKRPRRAADSRKSRLRRRIRQEHELCLRLQMLLRHNILCSQKRRSSRRRAPERSKNRRKRKPSKMKNVLITGANSYVGTLLREMALPMARQISCRHNRHDRRARGAKNPSPDTTPSFTLRESRTEKKRNKTRTSTMKSTET